MLACGSDVPAPRHTQSQHAPFAEVALSFDALPYQLDINLNPRMSDPNEQKDISTKMIAALSAAQVPATVFAICGKLPQSQGLARQWQQEGYTIGNYGKNALDPNLATIEQWSEEVAQCQSKIKKVDAKTKGWFRYPNLTQGWTKEKDKALTKALSDMALVPVPATIPVLDHLYNIAYEGALNERKSTFANTIAAQYIEHVRQSIKIAKELSFRRRSMTTPHIARLHVNRLNADHLPQLIEQLKSDDIRFISVHEAMQDPIYHEPNAYFGRANKSWLNRVSPLPNSHEESWFGNAAWRITHQYPQYLGEAQNEK